MVNPATSASCDQDDHPACDRWGEDPGGLAFLCRCPCHLAAVPWVLGLVDGEPDQGHQPTDPEQGTQH